MPIGKSIRIYLADATVSGIRYAELMNWTGQAIACPRNRLAGLSAWSEASKPGVYFLFEARLGDAKPMAYIGESENVTGRLTQHDRQKEFWNEVVLFTSKDENLTKAHVKFLESTLVALARKADRYELENTNTPTESSLPRPDQDAMAEFVENIRMILGTLGYPILEPLLAATPKPETTHALPASSTLELIFKVNNLVAKGVQTDEGFVIKKGALIASTNTDSLAPRLVTLKEQMIIDGRLDDKGDCLVLREDLLLSSSSYAAAFIAGTSRSGPQSWYTADGQSLKLIEEARITNA